ncbi:MAG TPA: methyltransferase domain-containing protein [Polyangia bacterium]|nr:methyltransferase domain-containing protein [Polyangia bacterium]
MPSVVDANIEVHSKMAPTYNESEPHFRPENQAKVRKVLEALRARVAGGKLLDLGCGTGFIINLARDLFSEIHGVDVTQAMLDRVATSPGNITLHNARAEKLPFADASFDLVSSYAFIHHTEDYWAILREAARVLKPGGLCYVDLEPNKQFWDHVGALAPDDPKLSPIVKKARASVTETDQQVERDFGIPAETFRTAEFSKAILGGIDAVQLVRRAPELGFKSVEVRREWFLGQAEVMHGRSFEEAARVEDYLRSVAPLSDHLFKYLQFIFLK